MSQDTKAERLLGGPFNMTAFDKELRGRAASKNPVTIRTTEGRFGRATIKYVDQYFIKIVWYRGSEPGFPNDETWINKAHIVECALS